MAHGLWRRAPRPELALGQHIASFAAGQIRLAHGPVCAQADSWLVRVQGRQAHAALTALLSRLTGPEG
ncbi:MAG: hypothetical protein LBL55_01465 [Propionibacteriaceae bacterium]|jgi:hippurate hydrolase|nr:hypothetical protein [Propionibacteriaceae bacterium]